jgi:adenylate cyclase
MLKMNSQKWIDSTELLDKCEISKPTLDYYIKLGIVPKPIVRNSEDGLTGYFPPEVIDTIDKVKQMKNEGETMEEIVKKVKHSPEGEHNDNTERKRVFLDERAERIIKDKIGTDSRGLHLTLVDIHTPAYLMNYQFEIEWINDHQRCGIQKCFPFVSQLGIH